MAGIDSAWDRIGVPELPPISPDDFEGTDRDKVEAAIRHARTMNPPASVAFDRRYDFGDGPVSCSNAAATASDFGAPITIACPRAPRASEPTPEGPYGYGIEYESCSNAPVPVPSIRAHLLAPWKKRAAEARFRIREAWNVLRNGLDIYR